MEKELLYETEYKASFEVDGFKIDFPINETPKIENSPSKIDIKVEE